MSFLYQINISPKWRFSLLLAASCLFHDATAVKSFKSHSLNSCMDGSSIAANLFNVTYTPDDGQIAFEINGYSQITSTILLDVELLVYGYSVSHPIVYPCELKDFAGLCPLNSGLLQIQSNFPAPPELKKRIPIPSYYVPDIDVKVRLLINSTESGETMGCVEADLDNDKTVHQKGVSWSIALIVLMSLVTSAINSGLGHSNSAAHLASNVLSVFGYFQAQALVGMTAVKMPPIVRAWTQNFQWSMGIIRLDSLQTLATWYQRSTGGTPSTYISTLATISVHVQKRSLLEKSDSTADEWPKMEFITVKGIERVGFVANIENTNIFFTSYTFFIMFVLFTTTGVLMFKYGCELLIRMRRMRPERFYEFRVGWKHMLKGILFRIVLITFPQVTVMGFWEMTKRDSLAEVFLAISSIITMVVLLSVASFKIWQYARRSIDVYHTPVYMLYSNANFLNKWGFLYVQFQAKMYFFFIPMLFYILIKSLFVAFGQTSGIVQAVAFVVLELALLLAFSILRPFMDKQTNGFNIAIAAVNFVNALLLLFFAGVFGVPPLAFSIMGVLFFVLNAIFALTMILLVICTSISAIISKNPDTKYQPMQDDRGSMIKSQNNLNNELDALGAIARSDAHGNIPIDYKHEIPLGHYTRQDDRENMSRVGLYDAERRGFEASGHIFSTGTAYSSLRDNQSRPMPVYPHGPVPGSGFSGSLRAENQRSRAQTPANWQKGVGF